MTENIVHIGKDGWLFLIGGTNNVLAQYQPGGIPHEHFRKLRHLHVERVRSCRERGARYVNVTVPEKISVYDDKLDGLGVDIWQGPAASLTRWLRASPAWGSHIDLLELFRSRRDHVQLYLRTDTHWSYAGCHLAYLAVCGRMGVRPSECLASPVLPASALVTGDLGVKFDPPRGEVVRAWTYPRRAERIYANALLRHFEAEGNRTWGGVGTHVVFRNETSGLDPRSLIVFGDSYSNHVCYPQVGALTAMLAETFRDVHFFWANTIDWNYVERIRPAFVLTQSAERFMIEMPAAGFDIAAFEAEVLARKIAAVA